MGTGTNSTNSREVDTIETEVKAWLNQYAEQVKHIDHLIDRADAMESRLRSPRTARLDGMPHGAGNDMDPTGTALGRLERLKAKIAEANKVERALYEERADAISQITGKRWSELQAVLELRYLEGMKWNDVNFSLFGNKEDFNEKEESYLRRSHLLHREALKALCAIVLLQCRGKEDTL